MGESLVDTRLNHLQVAFAEALESFVGLLAVVGDSLVIALQNVRADVVGAALAQLLDEIVDLDGKFLESKL